MKDWWDCGKIIIAELAFRPRTVRLSTFLLGALARCLRVLFVIGYPRFSSFDRLRWTYSAI
jgi:hypothetical protein